MPRIVAGWAGSLQLAAPASGTRPTSDRVREAIFSALEARDALGGARVLDLYAGSGALGLEAVSRGAAAAVLVDNGRTAARVLRQNVAVLRRAAPAGTPPDVRVDTRSVRGYLEASPEDGPDRPTLVFLDPPYDLAAPAVLADLTLLATRAAPGAVLVLERSTRSPAPEPAAGITLDRIRTYGDSAVLLLTVGTGPDQPAASAG